MTGTSFIQVYNLQIRWYWCISWTTTRKWLFILKKKVTILKQGNVDRFYKD